MAVETERQCGAVKQSRHAGFEVQKNMTNDINKAAIMAALLAHAPKFLAVRESSQDSYKSIKRKRGKRKKKR